MINTTPDVHNPSELPIECFLMDILALYKLFFL